MGLNVHVMCKYICNRVGIVIKGVTHDFGHSGDVSTSDVFRLPQGLFV
jgi:hypothetical protein